MTSLAKKPIAGTSGLVGSHVATRPGGTVRTDWNDDLDSLDSVTSGGRGMTPMKVNPGSIADKGDIGSFKDTVPILVKLLFEDDTPYKIVSNLKLSATISDLMRYSGPGFDILSQDGFVVSDPSTPLVSVATSASAMMSISATTGSNKNEFYVKLRSKRRTAAVVEANEASAPQEESALDAESTGTGAKDDVNNLKNSEKLQILSNCGLLFGRILSESPREAAHPLLRVVSDQIGAQHFRLRKNVVQVGKMGRNIVASKWAEQGFVSVDIETTAKIGTVFEMSTSDGHDVVKSLANLSSGDNGSVSQTAFVKELNERALIYINEDLVDYDDKFLRKLDSILAQSKSPTEDQVKLLRQLERQYGALVVTEAVVGAELGIKGYFDKTSDESEEQAIWEVLKSLKVNSLQSQSSGNYATVGAAHARSGASSGQASKSPKVSKSRIVANVPGQRALAPVSRDSRDARDVRRGLRSAARGTVGAVGAVGVITRKRLYVRGGEPAIASMGNIIRWSKTTNSHENWVLLRVLRYRPWYFMLDAARKNKVRNLINFSRGLNGFNSELIKLGRDATLQKKIDDELLILSFKKRSGSDDDDSGRIPRSDGDEKEEVDHRPIITVSARNDVVFDWGHAYESTLDDDGHPILPREVVIRRENTDKVEQLRLQNSSTGMMETRGEFGDANKFIIYATNVSNDEDEVGRFEVQFQSRVQDNEKFLRMFVDTDGSIKVRCDANQSDHATRFFLHFRKNDFNNKPKYVELQNVLIHEENVRRAARDQTELDSYLRLTKKIVGAGHGANECRLEIRTAPASFVPFDFDNDSDGVQVILRRKNRHQAVSERKGEMIITDDFGRDQSLFEVFVDGTEISFKNVHVGKFLCITNDNMVDINGEEGGAYTKFIFKVQEENYRVKLESKKTGKYLAFKPALGEIRTSNGSSQNAKFDIWKKVNV